MVTESSRVPHELAWGDVYYSPLLSVIVLAVIAAWITVIMMNKTRLSRLIIYPSTTFLAITVLYVVAIDALWIPF
ncbi:DUF1656 domain-containing protein [Photobacterium aphoticum]|uniref:DUF1656 domain-containing protein n=1 Tax=Photobacterium aphoticum TaxID=754436 RepID=A0A0J1GSS8_9GAMM|nr:DUF1656 domain-containing protein [Photobacterium aphoticum]KLV02768.1 hypothetical protein ABT58_01535 [Photobacterium aphoticum]PSU55215.1 DUF1656 domain-containing protein [Photobacterium aphoticum]GHA35900.1 DUF1656 domain-containing protein [Photobacterium aphoticum]